MARILKEKTLRDIREAFASYINKLQQIKTFDISTGASAEKMGLHPIFRYKSTGFLLPPAIC